MHYTAGGPRRHCRQLWGFLRGSTSVSLRRGGGGGGGGHDGRGGELPASLGPVGLDRVRGLVASTGPSLVGKATGDVRGQEVGVNFSEVRGARAGGARALVRPDEPPAEAVAKLLGDALGAVALQVGDVVAAVALGQGLGESFKAGAGGGGVGGVGVAAGGDSVGRVHGRRRRDLGAAELGDLAGGLRALAGADGEPCSG